MNTITLNLPVDEEVAVKDFFGSKLILNYTQNIGKPTEKEKESWLIRMLNNEPLLAETFKSAIDKLDGQTPTFQSKTIEEILEILKGITDNRAFKKQRAETAKQLARIEQTELNKESHWYNVLYKKAQKPITPVM